MSGKYRDYYVATGVKVGPGEPMPLRQDYRDLSSEQMYLYLEGLKRFQMSTEFEDPLSYFQIAGIHGYPHTTWPTYTKELKGGGTGGGFCTHSSVLFLTWHRPYLALFESALYDHVQLIADGIDDSHPQKGKYKELAKKFRIPYWDWARKDTEPAPMDALLEKYRYPNGFEKPASKNATPGLDADYNPLFRFTQPKGPVGNIKSEDLLEIRTQIVDYKLKEKEYVTKEFDTTMRYTWPSRFKGDPQSALRTFYDSPETANRPNLDRPIDPSTGEKKAERNLSERTAYILQAYSTYAAVSHNDFRYQFGDDDHKGPVIVKDAENWGSLEDIHNVIHNITGGGGNLTDVQKSSFDPIFWLHHTNIDRLFAIWQVLHEKEGVAKSFVEPRKSKTGTFMTKRGAMDDIDSSLYPFKKEAAAGSWFTSKDCRRTEAFGYSYPETMGVKWPPTAADISKVMKQVGDMYLTTPKEIRKSIAGNPKAGLAFLQQAAVVNKLEQRVEAHVPLTVAELDQIATEIPSSSTLLEKSSEPGKPFLKDLAPDRKYLEWIVDIRAEKHALNGLYSVHIFLGPADDEPEVALWPRAPTHVGTFAPLGQSADTGCAKCKEDQADHLIVTGQIPLTIALIERYLAGIIEDLTEQSVVPYLQKNLHWRVVGGAGQVIPDQSAVEGLAVLVVTNEVELPEDPDQLPIYAPDVKIYPEATTNREGGSRGHGTGLTAAFTQ